ncbi:MAG: 3-oxoadipate enol-lactonase [Rubrivivax sp.]|nr:3-oxoadipate enol-lactonase [Rubrivivax sp.]
MGTDRPWLVMSHSLACNIAMWDPQMPMLGKRFRVLRFDTRGHGASDAPPGPYTLEQLADDVKGLLDALGVRETHWMGLSMGGMIGQTFALKYPGILKSLVLADTSSRIPEEAQPLWAERIRIAESQGMEPLVQPTLERWFTAPYRAAQPEQMKRVGAMIRATPVAGYVGCCHAIPKLNLTARLKDIKVPTLVIVGDQDAGTPPAMAHAIHENLPGSELVTIKDASHLSNIEQPAAYDAALVRFYDRIGV